MRRADRLIGMVHFLRGRSRAVTAARIAEEFGICTRTIYRDIRDLMGTGAPITGEAGVGYIVDKRYYLPPITFDADELEAIGLGIAMVRQWTDDRFAGHADSALKKIEAALPTDLQGQFRQVTTWSVPMDAPVPWTVSFSALRDAIRMRDRLRIGYTDGSRRATSRTVRPLALIFCSPVCLLATWCETRGAFRNFHLDRIGRVEHGQGGFEDEEGRNLAAYRMQDSFC